MKSSNIFISIQQQKLTNEALSRKMSLCWPSLKPSSPQVVPQPQLTSCCFCCQSTSSPQVVPHPQKTIIILHQSTSFCSSTKPSELLLYSTSQNYYHQSFQSESFNHFKVNQFVIFQFNSNQSIYYFFIILL